VVLTLAVSLARSLNRIAQHQPWRLLGAISARCLVVVPVVILVVLAVGAWRRRDTQALAILVLAAAGCAAALAVNQGIGHLFFRLRPYWALPAVHAIGTRNGDSSFYSDHTTLTAGAAAGIWLVSRRWGPLTAAVADRPSDSSIGGSIPPRTPPRPTSRAATRACGCAIETVAAGHWQASRARLYGPVTYVNREPDGDVHVELRAPGHSFVVLEIIPELPLAAPHDDDHITAWGIVRHDGLHNWWELHPLTGWTYGHLEAPSTPGLND
jgi:hypothetical protein